MFKIGKQVLSLLLLVFIAAASVGCVNVEKTEPAPAKTAERQTTVTVED